MTKSHRQSIAFVTLAIVALYAFFWLQLLPWTIMDLPNHATRSFLIYKLSTDSTFNDLFSYQFHFVPYWLGDFAFATLFRFFSFEWGAKVWVACCYFSLPLALTFYARVRHGNETSLLLVLLSGLFLSSNWFFLAGYLNYCLGISIVFVALSALELYSNKKQSRSMAAVPWFLVYAMSAVACYLTHLAPFFFLCVIVAIVALARFVERIYRVGDVALAGAPLIALVILHFTNSDASAVDVSTYFYGPLSEKIIGAGGAFIRFSYFVDIFFFAAGAIVVFGLLFAQRAELRWRNTTQDVREYLIIILGLAIAFFLLPTDIGPNGEVDRRAIPFVCLFACLLAARIGRTVERHSLLVAGVPIAVNLLNLCYLQINFPKHAAFLQNYQQALLAIPADKVVLPVATRLHDGRIQSDRHFAETYVLERHGIVPFIFSKDTAGGQFTYFGYRHYPHYVPSESWYFNYIDVDWAQVAKYYDYVIVSRPYDSKRFPSAYLQPVAEYDTAVIFKTVR